jgi:hypothetical protein
VGAPTSAPAGAEITVELIIDSYRVTGELQGHGGPRRLVDLLNVSDEPFVKVRDGALDDPLIEGDEPRRFDTAQVHREAILFAIPRSDSDVHPDPYDLVKKVPVPTTITVPGFEINGNVHLLPEIDPTAGHPLGGNHFIPMTDVSIRTVAGSEPAWSEPVIVVNVSRVRLFAPRSG